MLGKLSSFQERIFLDSAQYIIYHTTHESGGQASVDDMVRSQPITTLGRLHHLSLAEVHLCE